MTMMRRPPVPGAAPRATAPRDGATCQPAPDAATEHAPATEQPVPGARRFGEPSLKGRALRLLSMREHSRAELERKLRPHDTEDGELARALDALQAKGFISDERVAESVVHHRGARYGALRVRAELQAKGLDDAIVREAVETLRATELTRATEVWRKKFGQPPADAAERAKQLRFLATRGFSGEVARRVIGGRDADEDGGE